MSAFTSFLFARPSMVEGAARILDFGNTLTEYNYSQDGELADNRAASCDWSAIGKDIEQALRAYSQRIAEGKSGVEALKAK